MYYGYHRVSSKGQKEDRGIAGIENFCNERNYPLQKIYVDVISGKKFDRPRYTVLKEDVLREGDTLILHELDRLGRNKREIANELQYFKNNNIRVMFLDIPTTTIEYSDISDTMYKLVIETVNEIIIELYSMQAQAELERKEKRQREGIQAKKDRGEWGDYGRPRIMTKEAFAEEYQKVERGELKSTELMRMLNLTSNTYFRYVREYRKSKDLYGGNIATS